MALDPRIDAFGEALLGQAARRTRDIAITLLSPTGMLSHTRWSYLTAECGITHEDGQPLSASGASPPLLFSGNGEHRRR